MQKTKTLKKLLRIGIIIIAIFSIIFYIILKLQYRTYSKIINENTNKIISKVIENYPEVKEEDILKIINSKEPAKENILEKYGYDKEIANIKEMKETMQKNGVIGFY